MLGEVCVTVWGGQCVSRPWLLDASPPSPRSQFILCSGTKGHWFTTRASQLLLVILAYMSDALLTHACNRTTSRANPPSQTMCMHAVPFTLKQRLSAYLFALRTVEREEADSGGVPLIMISRLIEDKLITTPTTLTLACSHVTLLANYRAPC
jgi:hypothetical protein